MADKSVISNLEARVRQLIEAHRRMAEHCAELEAQQETLRAEKRSLEERVRELERRSGAHAAHRGSGGGIPNREKARARVNRLMREVDKCIALVGQAAETAADRKAE